jgi:hypothetical protein
VSDGKSGDTIYLNVSVTPPAGGNAQSSAQWGKNAGLHIRNSLRKNG